MVPRNVPDSTEIVRPKRSQGAAKIEKRKSDLERAVFSSGPAFENIIGAPRVHRGRPSSRANEFVTRDGLRSLVRPRKRKTELFGQTDTNYRRPAYVDRNS